MKKMEPNTVSGNLIGHSADQRQDPSSRRATIAAKARMNPQECFNNVLHHLTYELVKECLAKIPKSSAVGVDGMTVEQARENLSWLLPPILQQIHEGRYEPPAVRRVYIPKQDGKLRPLGVPAVLDRAIQSAMTQILNEIYEQDFLNCSFGFRPGLSCHHALATVNSIVFRFRAEHILEVDIQDFFGSLSHEWLMKFLGLRVGDRRVLQLIKSWLKAGVLENGEWSEMKKGTPQGGSISPLLGNIYLHYVLDLWFEKKIKPNYQGKANLVRYADDFALFFNKPSAVENILAPLKARLAQFGLSISEQKTHQTNLQARENTSEHYRRRMTFLGFSIYRTRSRQGSGTKTVFETDSKRLSRAKRTMKEKLKSIRHRPLKAQSRIINAILRGHINYFGIAGNGKKLGRFRNFVRREWKHWLSHRSQHGRLSWDDFLGIEARFPLAAPKIRISYQELQSFARL